MQSIRKYLCWVLLLAMFCAVSYGGCGGSSSSIGSDNGGSSDGNGTGQEQNTAPENNSGNSGNVGTPQNPEQNVTPETPSNQDTQPTTYDFSILEGTWKASNGTGTIEGDINTTMNLSTRHSNTITFMNVNVSGSTATLELASEIYMDIVGYPDDDWEDEFGAHRMTDGGVVEFQNTSGNTWYAERTNHYDKPVKTTITFTSSTTAQVERSEETNDAKITASYTITKQ